MALNDQELQWLYEFRELNKLEWFVSAINLKEGNSFGELGSVNQTRKSNIICVKDCVFGLLSQEQYQKIFVNIEKQEQIKKIKFLQSVPFLQHWTKKSLESLCQCFVQKKYFRNQLVYSQNDKVNEVYIIESGEFSVQRTKVVQQDVH